MDNKRIAYIVCAIILSLGIISAGHSIGKAVYKIRMLGRSVTVKGLAERDVKSDLGIWEINYREIGNDLVQMDQRLQRDQQIVVDFLKQQGFSASEIDRTPLKVEDRFANVYNQAQQTGTERYVVTSGARVRSTKVDLIRQTAQILDKLLNQGVSLAFDVSSLSPNPSYFYTQLDEIRPDMMSVATQSAYTVAKQFAKDSDSSLAGIQRATQGVFQIMSRDTSTMSADWNSNQNALGSIDKKVRLVTTIEYRLK